MAIQDKEVRLIPASLDGLARPALEAQHELFTDVRATVESQFRQMELSHDRIRAEELAARLAARTID